MSRKKNAPKFSSFQANGALPEATNPNTDARGEKVDAVKKFSSTTNVANPYQSLSATSLSRVVTKKLPENMDGLVQYYNHIDAIHATSFVEKCRVLAHANAIFRYEGTRDGFRREEGGWLEFVGRIGLSQSQVSRFVSFWNVFGEDLLVRAVEEELTASKLAELLSWPEDPRAIMLEERTYQVGDDEKTVYEMTREELREVKRMLNERKSGKVVEHEAKRKPAKIFVDFADDQDPLFKTLNEKARKEGLRPEEVIREALKKFFENEI